MAVCFGNREEIWMMTGAGIKFWLVYIVLILLAVFGVSGNVMVIYAFRRVGVKAPYQLFAVALAVNDLVMCTVCTPTLPLMFTGFIPVSVKVVHYSLIGYIFCNNANFFILIAVYRLVAVIKKVPGHFSMSVARWICVGTFTFSLLPFTMRTVGRFGYTEAAYGGCVYGLLQYFLAFAVTSGCYVTVYLRIGPCRRNFVTPRDVPCVSARVAMPDHAPIASSSNDLITGSGPVNVNHAGPVTAERTHSRGCIVQQIKLKKNSETAKRAAFTLLVSTLVFLICFAPTELGDKLGLFPDNIRVLRFLIFIQNVTNPIIYYITQPKFKSEVKRVFRKCSSCFSRV